METLEQLFERIEQAEGAYISAPASLLRDWMFKYRVLLAEIDYHDQKNWSLNPYGKGDEA